MKLALAQIPSIPGAIPENLSKHLDYIKKAQEAEADLVVFPELSLSSYGTKDAMGWAQEIQRLDWGPVQDLVNKASTAAAIGVPHIGERGIEIALYIFRPNEARDYYAKQMLHDDEKPYFVEGKHTNILNLKGRKIGLGICYESLQEEHLQKAIEGGAEVYIASQAKDQAGLFKAHAYFKAISAKYKVACLMVNNVGSCADFHCAGGSGIFESNGTFQIASASEEELILYELHSIAY